MQQNKEKIPGILGGMGPEATVDLLQRIIRLTPARGDADHIRCIIDNNPKVPSRIKAILENGENPGPCMADMGKRLEAWGADFLAIPCNTAHYYYSYVQQAVTIPVLHIVDLAIDQVLRKNPAAKQVGVLGTPMVRLTELYTQRLGAKGLQAVYLPQREEDMLFTAIQGIKGKDTGLEQQKRLQAAKAALFDQGAQVCVLACTELGVLLHEDERTTDAAEALAKAIVATAKGTSIDHPLFPL